MQLKLAKCKKTNKNVLQLKCYFMSLENVPHCPTSSLLKMLHVPHLAGYNLVTLPYSETHTKIK